MGRRAGVREQRQASVGDDGAVEVEVAVGDVGVVVGVGGERAAGDLQAVNATAAIEGDGDVEEAARGGVVDVERIGAAAAVDRVAADRAGRPGVDDLAVLQELEVVHATGDDALEGEVAAARDDHRTGNGEGEIVATPAAG